MKLGIVFSTLIIVFSAQVNAGLPHISNPSAVRSRHNVGLMSGSHTIQIGSGWAVRARHNLGAHAPTNPLYSPAIKSRHNVGIGASQHLTGNSKALIGTRRILDLNSK